MHPILLLACCLWCLNAPQPATVDLRDLRALADAAAGIQNGLFLAPVLGEDRDNWSRGERTAYQLGYWQGARVAVEQLEHALRSPDPRAEIREIIEKRRAIIRAQDEAYAQAPFLREIFWP